MSKQYIIGIDQSTSGTKLILVNEQGEIVYKDSLKHQQYYPPQDNWIEHDPVEIYDNVKALINKLMNKTIVPSSSLKALSITNQRETVLAWDKHTGEPIYNAIVWQCTRTQEVCNHLKMNGYEALIKSKTGLTIDPYFSATKIQWLLENVESAKEKIANLDLLVGTIDSWIVWKLTGGKTHATDVTNASRTLLYNIYSLKWDRELLDLFRIPEEMLPEVKNCDEIYGRVSDVNILLKDIPISGVIGDSQAALFGQRCFEEGATKATFGTGTSVLVHTDKLMETEKGLVTCVAWGSRWNSQLCH
ncbi:glycerol kinase [Gracilibacillus boraciitolerans JCM 21714]|uniref:ATP:glycerol 3-phosphotransferase n=1 Tax=Gracilibacillus boraciitolerans JCM 21714 TaxID=1298598 RepID=W4VI70_9BACI|nr:glycerol kinase [Gracilibacillus boraciitolerans JCM 21714]